MFPYSNVVVGILVLIIGFGFHWIGQLYSVLNWDHATKIGLQEKALLPEYRVYEHAIAVADSAIGWLYGIAGVGLILGAQWGYKLAWFPGVVFIYHSIMAWVWEENRRKSGHQFWSDRSRILWCLSNFVTGALVIFVAWNAG